MLNKLVQHMDYKNILISTNVSKVISEGYKHLIYLARLRDTKTRIVNVIDALDFVALPVDGTLDRIIKITLIELDKITQHVKKLFASRGIDECKVGVTLLQGHTIDEINVYADTHHVDFVIFGTRERTRLDRLLIGSAAEKVISICKVPVVVIRGE